MKIIGEGSEATIQIVTARADQFHVKRFESMTGVTPAIFMPWHCLPHLFLSNHKGTDKLKTCHDLKYLKTNAGLTAVRSFLSSNGLGNDFDQINQDHVTSIEIDTFGYNTDSPFFPYFNYLDETISSLPDWLREKYDRLVAIVIPRKYKPGITAKADGSGLSSIHFRKVAFLSLPTTTDSKNQFLLNYAHEAGHQALHNLQHFDQIIYNGLETMVHSRIRGHKRPAIQSFHALIAIGYMLELATHIQPSDSLSANFWCTIKTKLKQLLALGISDFDHIKFTPVGSNLLKQLKSVA